MVLATGFEPVTPRSTIWCSNQLSYASKNELVLNIQFAAVRFNAQTRMRRRNPGGADNIL